MTGVRQLFSLQNDSGAKRENEKADTAADAGSSADSRSVCSGGGKIGIAAGEFHPLGAVCDDISEFASGEICGFETVPGTFLCTGSECADGCRTVFPSAADISGKYDIGTIGIFYGDSSDSSGGGGDNIIAGWQSGLCRDGICDNECGNIRSVDRIAAADDGKFQSGVLFQRAVFSGNGDRLAADTGAGSAEIPAADLELHSAVEKCVADIVVNVIVYNGGDSEGLLR